MVEKLTTDKILSVLRDAVELVDIYILKKSSHCKVEDRGEGFGVGLD